MVLKQIFPRLLSWRDGVVLFRFSSPGRGMGRHLSGEMPHIYFNDLGVWVWWPPKYTEFISYYLMNPILCVLGHFISSCGTPGPQDISEQTMASVALLAAPRWEKGPMNHLGHYFLPNSSLQSSSNMIKTSKHQSLLMQALSRRQIHLNRLWLELFFPLPP